MAADLASLFPHFSVVPVVVLDQPEDAVPLAEALLEGGVRSIEITLRTQAGLAAIEAVAARVPDILVGSGTICTPQQMDDARNAGARFQVSPGITPGLAAHAAATGVAWLPGVANASDILLGIEHGLSHLKFFPASLSGGVEMLRQFGSVFPALRFCPTGGIDGSNLAQYRSLPHLFAVGGSWLTPKDAIKARDWAKITALAAQATSAQYISSK